MIVQIEISERGRCPVNGMAVLTGLSYKEKSERFAETDYNREVTVRWGSTVLETILAKTSSLCKGSDARSVCL